jgi:hypothetical protein
VAAFDQRADGDERIAVARFEDAGESSEDVGRERAADVRALRTEILEVVPVV